MTALPASAKAVRSDPAQPDSDDRFIRYVLERCSQSNAARADLRSGLGRPMAECRRMDPHLAWRLSEGMADEVRSARYQVAALIAAQPRRDRRLVQSGSSDRLPLLNQRPNLGASLAHGVREGVFKAGSAEAELLWMARQSLDSLRLRLPSLVMPLLAKDVNIDWAVLLGDLKKWDRASSHAGTEWIRSFHQVQARDADAENWPCDRGPEQFVQRVLDLCNRDKGARADLRRGRGLPVARCLDLHRHLVPLLPDQQHSDDLRAHYAVAALIADRPPSARKPAEAGAELDQQRSDLGVSLAHAANKKVLSPASVEQDLHLIARQSGDAFHTRLPGLATLLLSKGVTIDWAHLIDDLAWWNRDRDRIATRWLDNYFATLRAHDDRNSMQGDNN
ncbi:type I-E CRISPR-associated protein Cse2/CasB [Kitasatospora sp. NPDC058965]|uniref:type I-E CRISPR-associated protein Cse2/CasB n=1 Tax=Kitasatospora sp. NPDC058965 TaxID=3346682 RepID=UPI0036AA79C9